MKKFILLLASLFLFQLCGCQKDSTPISITDFKLNTIVSITLYDSKDEQLLEECLSICDKYENIFSRTKEDSELYRLNHRDSSISTFKLSHDLYHILLYGYDCYKETNGTFNIAIAPLSSLWDFTADDPVIPDEYEIKKALPACNWNKVVFKENNTLSLSDLSTTFDLGALAKGYIADKIKAFLVSQNVKSAVINLGGNVLCIGTKPDKTPFKIGIQKPFADRNETAATVNIQDCSVVSSGIYERCFEKDGTLYHHILDAQTGYPVKNDLISATVITKDSLTGDYLSTACFALGLEKGLAFAKKNNIAAAFITSEYEIIYSPKYISDYLT